jgi:pyridoxal phosphate enzyme (YggS family)
MEGVISANLAAVRARIAAAAEAAGRRPDIVELVAVGKTHPAAAVREALLAGQRVFGENRVQEAQAKYPALREEFPDLVLHLIGPLQTNKVREAVALCDVIETVDRPRLAEALVREMEKTGRRPPCFVEVNTGEEKQKSGVLPEAADGFISECRDRLGLPIVGLMCVPPQDEEPALHFALLREIARRNDLTLLSMGMSGDYETAISFGATHVRIGTAIFGARGT